MSGLIGGGGGLGQVATAADWTALQLLPATPGGAAYLQDADQLVVYPSAETGWIPAMLANSDRSGLSTEVGLWADAGDIQGADHVGGALATWPLKSGVTKATAANSPTYSATGGNGSRPGVTLNGSNQRIALPSDHLGLLNGASGAVVFLVANASSLGQSNLGTWFAYLNAIGNSLFKVNYQASPNIIRIGTDRGTGFSGANLAIGASTGAWHLLAFEASRPADRNTIYSSDTTDADGLNQAAASAVHSSTGNFAASDAGSAFIGAQSTTLGHYAGTISEVIALSGSWTELEQRPRRVMAYLQSKWGLA